MSDEPRSPKPPASEAESPGGDAVAPAPVPAETATDAATGGEPASAPTGGATNALPAPGAAESGAPMPRRELEEEDDRVGSWAGASVATRRWENKIVAAKLLMLVAKLMPMGLVLVGVYYVYQTFFGPLSEEELAQYASSPYAGASAQAQAAHAAIDAAGVLGQAGPTAAGGGGTAGGAVGGAGGAPGATDAGVAGAAGLAAGMPKSRAGMMIQKTKDVVALHDKGVAMVNALAEAETGGLGIDHIDQDSPTGVAPGGVAGPGAVAVAPAGSASTPVPTVLASGEAAIAKVAVEIPAAVLDGRSDAEAVVAPERTEEAAVAIAPDAAPSREFRAWAAGVRVSGVRGGQEGRAVVNNRLVLVGELADRKMRIWLERVDVDSQILIFKDHTGAILGKRY